MLSLVVLGCLSECLSAQETLPVPNLNVSGFHGEVRRQVEDAYLFAKRNPREAEANGKLGMVLEAYDQLQTASIFYTRAHVLASTDFRWSYYLGGIHAKQGNCTEAGAALRDSLRVNPEYLPAQLQLAECLLDSGELEQSHAVYTSILKKHPDSAETRYGLGRISLAQADYRTAVDNLRQACNLFPAYGAAHYGLALAYRKQEEAKKSQDQFRLYEQNKSGVPPLEDPLRRAVTDLDRGPHGHIRRGAAFERAGQLKQAIAEYESALREDPTRVQADVMLISLYGRLGQFEIAERCYKSGLKITPDQVDLHQNYGVLLSSQNRFLEAEGAFRKALEINSNYAKARDGLGDVLEQQHKVDEAKEEYEKAIAAHPDYRPAHYHLGRLLASQGFYEEAISHLLKTLKPEDERTPAYLYVLSAAYVRAGHREEALHSFRRARDMASVRGQTQLVANIERDLHALEIPEKQP